jgi:hypothetical protein
MLISKVDNLSLGSSKIIIAKCDYCDNEKEISFKEYNRNIKSNGKFSCCCKCGALKVKENNIIKYGVDSTNKLADVKNKSKKTLKEKYGVNHVSQILEVSEKKKDKKLSKIEKEKISNTHKNRSNEDVEISNKLRIQTVNDIYGVENISQLKEIKQLKEQTINRNYGGFTYNSDILKEKVKHTILEKYGTINLMLLDEIKEKIKKTNLDKYGFEYPSQNENVKNRIRNTMLEKYGVDNIMFSEDFRKHNMIIGKDGHYIRYIGGRINLFNCDCGYDHNFEIDTDNYFKRKSRNNKLCTKCYPINENVSIKEKELLNYIKSIYNDEIIENYRDSLEIDIYLPKEKIGFEFNGLYWHSNKFSAKDRHIDKLNYFKNLGIRIYFIWEDDWDFKNDIIKSQIKNWLNITEHKVWARKCVFNEITDVNIIRNFLNTNHIQGFIHSSKKYGLFYKNELISLMTFDKFEGRKKLNDTEWNLNRFCSKLHYNIVGGFSKLLTNFIKCNNVSRIITYADKEWSDGNLYIKNNFDLISESDVSYKYLVNNKRLHKQNFKKSKLKIIYENVDNLTENQIMKKLNIYRIYDCGQLKFQLIIS